MELKLCGTKSNPIYIAICCILALQFCFLLPFVDSILHPLFFLFEIIVLLIVSMALKSKALNILLIIPIFLEAAQYASLYSTGSYIIPLTILNICDAASIGKELLYISLIIISYIILFYVNIYLLKKVKRFSRFQTSIACIAYIIVMMIAFVTYNKQVTWKKYPFPLENISFITYRAAKILRTLPTDTFAKSFEKNGINTSFKDKISAKNFKNYNVIVIFLEGTSSRVLSEDVTPHILQLRKKSIDIKNYFNHTAATFRGLRGQLISGFCLKGGRDYARDLQGVDELAQKSYARNIPRIESLPYILEKRGYTTVFISPHDKDEGLASVMESVGFQQVLTAENFGEKFSDALTDKQSYEFLWKELMGLQSFPNPFFLCLYQLGTHHGMDSPDKKFGDGKNPYLNKFHNADFWLGQFVEKFLANNISKNTFLILTADHATYSTPEYRKTFNTKTQYFVDEIPFIIFSKDISGTTIDADYSNSLSFAPTILDILGVDKVNNHFLGDSIFFDGRQNDFSKIACIGYECYHIGKSGVKIIEDDSYREILELIHNYLSYSG